MSRRTLLRTATAAAVAAGSVPARAATAATTSASSDPVNVQVSTDGYGLHAEPFVAASPVDPRNLLGACMVGPAGNPQFIATYASFDSGRSWRDNGALPLPAGTAFADDVTVAFTPRGRGFVCAMATSGLARNDRGVYLWRTDDGGNSFAAPLAVMSGQFADHPWLAADRVRGQGRGPGNLYTVWVASDHAALGFARSVDGGASFEAPRPIQGADTDVSTPMVAAGSDGIVAAIYEGPMDPAAAPDLSFAIEVVCSADGGATFAAPITLGQEAGAIELPGGVQPNSGPSIAVSPCGDTVYAAFTTHQPGSDHSDIAVSVSFDGGAAWSVPRPITPADHVVYFQPQLAIDESGRVVLSAFALSGGRVNVVLFASPPGRPRFGPPRTVTSTGFDPGLIGGGGKHGAWWIGDYQGLVATRGRAHPFWNDTRTGRLDLFTATVDTSI